MLYSERSAAIMNRLNQKNAVTVKELSKELNVSVDTIRRDLKNMEQNGLLVCVHGGACLPDLSSQFSPFNGREIIHVAQKQELVKKAVRFLKDGDIAAINSGTTGTVLAKELAQTRAQATIVTNNIAVTSMLIGYPTIQVIATGGLLDGKEQSLYGHDCEEAFLRYHYDICFLSMNAVSLEDGYTDFRLNEIPNICLIAERSDYSVAVMDSSKLETTSKRTLFPINKIDCLITDSLISPELRQQYLESDVHLL